MSIPQEVFPALSSRMNSKYKKRLPHECWIWQGAKTQAGYGYLATIIDGRRRQILAHRLVVALKLGSWPESNTFACHHCDTPLCVNPDHIYAGTPASNNADKMKRNRYKTHWIKGYRHSKRTIDLVLAKRIWKLYFGSNGQGAAERLANSGDGWTIIRLAKEFKLGVAAVRRLCRFPKASTRIDKKTAQRVRDLWFSAKGQGSIYKCGTTSAKWNARTLAEHFSLSHAAVTQLLRGITYHEVSRSKGALTRPTCR